MNKAGEYIEKSKFKDHDLALKANVVSIESAKETGRGEGESEKKEKDLPWTVFCKH